MVVMALDHTRDYFHFGAIHGTGPLDFATTTPALFLTRWITHFCAPVFSFLAGTGVFISASRGKSKRDLSWFLVTRGLWLILLELTVITWFGWNFVIDLKACFLGTLWALGTAMIFLAVLIHVPLWLATTVAVALITTHNAFDGIKPESWGAFATLWKVLHAGGTFDLGPKVSVLAFYPVLPWLGVMTAGYAFGSLLTGEPAVRRQRFLHLGLALISAFLVLRLSNLYGDPRPWKTQSTPVFTVLSVLNCEKYPPSLCYLLMTLGPALVLLSWFERGTPALLKPILVYGRVPMFYYLLHIPLIHAVAVIVERLRLGHAEWLFIGSEPVKPPPEAGFGLPVVYLVWIAIVVSLYPACRWFADLKRRRRDVWLSYF